MLRPLLFAASVGLLFLFGRTSAESLVWQDEFDGLNENEWTHLVTAWGGGNNEFQYYRNDRRNSYVRDGILYLKPTFTSDEYGDLNSGSLSFPGCNFQPCASTAGADIVSPVLSARMTSNYAFTYGRAEIRAKLPRGDWIWPAIWMLPKSSVYGQWPRSGEIDIMESRGNKNLVDGSGASLGCDTMGSTLHWGPDANHNNYWRTHWEKSIAGSGQDLASDFHLYGVTRTDNHLIFTFDNQVVGDVWAPQNGFWYFGNFENDPGGTNIWQNGNWMAPFDQEFQFILNVAVGGGYFPDGVGNRPWNWDGHPMRDFWDRRGEWQGSWNGEDTALKIDYIRVYQ